MMRLLLVLLAALSPLASTYAVIENTTRIDEGATPLKPVEVGVPPVRDTIPPKPASYILDRGNVLLPEHAARLHTFLESSAALGVQVYVITLPTLGVEHSKRVDRLQDLAKHYSDAWTSHTVGAVILFDDETGLITVDFSKQTSERFNSLALEGELKEALNEAQKIGLARDKIESMTVIVAEGLGKFQKRDLVSSHHQRIASFIMGSICLLGLGLAIFSITGKPKGSPATPLKTEVENNSPIDF